MDSTGVAPSLPDCFKSSSTAGTALSSDEIDYTHLVKNKPYDFLPYTENNIIVYLPFCVVESSAGSVGLLLLEGESAWSDVDSSWTAGALDSGTKIK